MSRTHTRWREAVLRELRSDPAPHSEGRMDAAITFVVVIACAAVIVLSVAAASLWVAR